MGLEEKRRLAAIRENHAPRFQSELKTAAGMDLPFEINMATFPENKVVLDCYDYYFESYGPGLVVKVFKDLCKDNLGKDAVKEKIKKVVFENTAKSPDDKGHKEIKLENGTLFIRESFYGYSDILFGEDDLRQAIEAML
jgi:hypothetical protein